MNNFEKLKSMSVDELALYLDENIPQDDAIWWKWFDKTYCDKCESETVYVDDYFLGPNTEHKCAYCEVHNTCRFFPGCSFVVENKDAVKLWLEAEVE